MNELMSLTTIIFVIGVLAFLVSVVVQVIKSVSVFAKIPTDLVVFVLSILLTVVALFVYASYYGLAVLWYYVVGAILVGFIVALVAMQGWDKVSELAKRFIKKDLEDK